MLKFSSTTSTGDRVDSLLKMHYSNILTLNLTSHSNSSLNDFPSRFIFPSDRVEVVDVSSEMAILSISLVQLDPDTNDVMHWNERGKLDESRFHRIRFESGGQKDGKEEEGMHEGLGSAIVIPAASEVDMTVAKALLCTSKDEDFRSFTRSCLVDSAFCVVKQAAAPCSTADMTTSASQSATLESNLMASIYSAALLILSGGVGGSDNNDLAKQSNSQTRIMFGGGDVGAVWWDCARWVMQCDA